MYDLTIKQRLRRFAESLGMDIATFERESGAGKNNLRGDTDPSMRVIVPVLKNFPQLSPDWLLTGEGSMLRPLREHPSVITATVPVDSSSGDNSEEYDDGFADINDPEIKAALNPFYSVAEPTQPYRKNMAKETITIPLIVWDQLRKQLENKDAQIATLLTAIQH